MSQFKRSIMKSGTGILTGGMVGFLFVTSAFAAAIITVTPTISHDWTTDDTRPGGAVNFITDVSAPGGKGALQLTTDLTTTSKAQYMHAASTSLASVTELSYYTKQNSASFAQGDPSYQLPIFANGTSSSFTSLVYEPYYNPTQGTVTPGVWQKWDVDQGLFWSSRTVSCPNGTIVGTPGGPASYTLDQIKTMCPNAVVVGYGVNVGSNNPGYDVETNLFNFNGTTYFFETKNLPPSYDACKSNYKNYTDQHDRPFTSQKQCTDYLDRQ